MTLTFHVIAPGMPSWLGPDLPSDPSLWFFYLLPCTHLFPLTPAHAIVPLISASSSGFSWLDLAPLSGFLPISFLSGHIALALFGKLWAFLLQAFMNSCLGLVWVVRTELQVIALVVSEGQTLHF